MKLSSIVGEELNMYFVHYYLSTVYEEVHCTQNLWNIVKLHLSPKVDN